ncbi:glycogen/starch/alpha-glucan phosphorylase [Candidatus Saccharibacteria bacterium]|nr:glycogen/starch/alpha-glucan phosphorylase [Candidatus Saccharibacteria bacterium]MBQ3441538.1 glycogen/starch/alpha-glucan phosphorylase [Candidatus Saccharibacteria bacterium]
MDDGQYFYHPLENIEDVELFYEAVERNHLTKAISPERPYTYWTIELYDQKNGIRGGGGLGVLAADTRRVAEKMNIPFALITPFYPYETHQTIDGDAVRDNHVPVDYKDFGFKFIDTVNVKCCDNLCRLDVIEKRFKNTRIIAITEPNFGELYSGMSGSDHRLYQEVALGFGGYAALKLLGLKPAIMQLNEVATFFAALARLDELTRNGMDFYEAVVYTRKHTLYTNHTLVQAAEAEFSQEQFERFVFPNLKSLAVKKWLADKFTDGHIKLSSVTIEIAELRSGVSKLHARVANYRDIAGNKVKFKAVTNGIDMDTWVLPEIMEFYRSFGILDEYNVPTADYAEKLGNLGSGEIRDLKKTGRKALNKILKERPDHNGRVLEFGNDDFIFDFKRRFVDYKRPELPFRDPVRLRNILEGHNAHYIIAGRVHAGDKTMSEKLRKLLDVVAKDDYLRDHVHYIPDYDEKLAYGLSVGSNAAINVPIVGLEACGTSWMKDVANLNFLISTHDGGVADASANSYLNVSGANEEEELDMLYQRMEEALVASENDFDLEYILQQQLKAYLPVISGSRMLKDYLDYLFPA